VSHLFVLLSMLCVIGMASAIPLPWNSAAGDPVAARGVRNTMADGLTRFAVFYVCIRGILILNYARAYLVIEPVRPLLRGFMFGFSIGCGFWLCAAYASSSMPIRSLFIMLGLAADYGTPFALLPMMVRVHPTPRPYIVIMSIYGNKSL